MKDKHLGRQSPAFNILSSPEKYIRLINQHGTLTRIMQARVCPCVETNGSPSMYCKMCNGDGHIYSFQRKLLIEDEDSEREFNRNQMLKKDTFSVFPFRVPVLEPLKVERLLPPEQGGIVEYNIDSFTGETISISRKNETDPYPLHYEPMRVSYYSDRYVLIENEYPEVDSVNSILTLQGTKFSGEWSSGNVKNVHGDVAIVTSIYSVKNRWEYKNFTFRKNKIYVNTTDEPELSRGDIRVSYYFCPPAKTLPADPSLNIGKSEKWVADMASGSVRVAFEPWFEVGQGDIITFLTTIYYKNEVLIHNTGLDKLREFDIDTVQDDIIDETGKIYRKGINFINTNFRDIKWIGEEPAQGARISIRYGHYPTFIIFEDEPVPNSLENKQYPRILTAKNWSKTMSKDLSFMSNPVY